MGNPTTAYEHWNYPPPYQGTICRATRRARDASGASTTATTPSLPSFTAPALPSRLTERRTAAPNSAASRSESHAQRHRQHVPAARQPPQLERAAAPARRRLVGALAGRSRRGGTARCRTRPCRRARPRRAPCRQLGPVAGQAHPDGALSRLVLARVHDLLRRDRCVLAERPVHGRPAAPLLEPVHEPARRPRTGTPGSRARSAAGRSTPAARSPPSASSTPLRTARRQVPPAGLGQDDILDHRHRRRALDERRVGTRPVAQQVAHPGRVDRRSAGPRAHG